MFLRIGDIEYSREFEKLKSAVEDLKEHVEKFGDKIVLIIKANIDGALTRYIKEFKHITEKRITIENRESIRKFLDDVLMLTADGFEIYADDEQIIITVITQNWTKEIRESITITRTEDIFTIYDFIKNHNTIKDEIKERRALDTIYKRARAHLNLMKRRYWYHNVVSHILDDAVDDFVSYLTLHLLEGWEWNEAFNRALHDTARFLGYRRVNDQYAHAVIVDPEDLE